MFGLAYLLKCPSNQVGGKGWGGGGGGGGLAMVYSREYVPIQGG